MTIGAHIGCNLEIRLPERTPFEPGDPDETTIVDGGVEIPATGIVSTILTYWSPVTPHTAIGTQIDGP